MKKLKYNTIKILFNNIVRSLLIQWRMNHLKFILIIVVILGISITPFITVYLQAQLINQITDVLFKKTQNLHIIWFTFGVLVVTKLLDQILAKFDDYIDRTIFYDWHKQMIMDVNTKAASLDIKTLESPKVNTLLHRVRMHYTHSPGNFIRSIFSSTRILIKIISTVVILLSFSWILVPIMLIALLPQFFVSLKSSKQEWGIWDSLGEEVKTYYKTEELLVHSTTVQEVKIFGAKSYLLNIIYNILDAFLRKQKKIARQEVKLSILAKIVELAIATGIEIQLLIKLLSGITNFGLGTYTFYISIINNFFDSTKELLHTLNRLYENNLSMKDLYDFLDLKNAIKVKEQAVIMNTDTIPLIEFKNVSFKYPRTKHNVFTNLSLTINPGEDIALVGENGAGKTTFVKLLCRFYDVNKGEILINGINIKNLDLDSWYQNLGVLFQQFNQYPLSVQGNIIIGNTTQRRDKTAYNNAVTDAGLNQMITNFKYGNQQILNQEFIKGTNISGGQWQRVALARAFYRNANVLILDEPTSAVDAKAEYEIFNKINKTQQDKTTIIISHRFSTVRNADRIYVIDQGQLIECGSHQQLMKRKNGKYKKMFNLQAAGYR